MWANPPPAEICGPWTKLKTPPFRPRMPTYSRQLNPSFKQERTTTCTPHAAGASHPIQSPLALYSRQRSTVRDTTPTSCRYQRDPSAHQNLKHVGSFSRFCTARNARVDGLWPTRMFCICRPRACETRAEQNRSRRVATNCRGVCSNRGRGVSMPASPREISPTACDNPESTRGPPDNNNTDFTETTRGEDHNHAPAHIDIRFFPSRKIHRLDAHDDEAQEGSAHASPRAPQPRRRHYRDTN